MPSLSQEDKELLNRLNRQPNLKKRIQAVLSIAEDDGEGIVKADEAERNNSIRAGVQTAGKTAPTVQSKCGDNLPLPLSSSATRGNGFRGGSLLRSGS